MGAGCWPLLLFLRNYDMMRCKMMTHTRLKMSEMLPFALFQFAAAAIVHFLAVFVDECVSEENRLESSTLSVIHSRNRMNERKSTKLKKIRTGEQKQLNPFGNCNFLSLRKSSCHFNKVGSCNVSLLSDLYENVVEQRDRKTYSYAENWTSNMVQCYQILFNAAHLISFQLALAMIVFVCIPLISNVCCTHWANSLCTVFVSQWAWIRPRWLHNIYTSNLSAFSQHHFFEWS